VSGPSREAAVNEMQLWDTDGNRLRMTDFVGLPRGIKIGGSFPQNIREQNPCSCRFDSLTFLDTAATDKEVAKQYRRFLHGGR
jgi:hypothetical protein